MFQSFVRNQQVGDLLKAFPDCRPVSPDKTLLELPVSLPDGRRVSLRIALPPSFPKEPPALSFTAPIAHPWVDKICRVTSPGVTQWTGAQNLTAAVREVVAAVTSQRPNSSGSINQNTSASVPTSFPQLSALPSEDLHKALVDKDAYNDLLAQIAVATPLNGANDAATLRVSNIELAKSNLAAESRLAEARNQIAIVRSTDYEPARAAHEEMCLKQEALRKGFAPEALMQRLKTAVETAESDARELERKLKRGDITVDAFVEDYVAARELYHQRDLTYKAAAITIPMDVPKN